MHDDRQSNVEKISLMTVIAPEIFAAWRVAAELLVSKQPREGSCLSKSVVEPDKKACC